MKLHIALLHRYNEAKDATQVCGIYWVTDYRLLTLLWHQIDFELIDADREGKFCCFAIFMMLNFT